LDLTWTELSDHAAWATYHEPTIAITWDVKASLHHDMEVVHMQWNLRRP
jgi:hypothetical protein